MNEQVSSAVALFGAAVDRLLDAPLHSLDAVEVARVLEGLETQRRRLEAVDQRVIAAARTAGLASAYGQPGMATVLMQLLRIDPREAHRRVGRAEDLGPRTALTGEPLGPILAATAEAVRDGAVSAAQVDVVRETLDHLSPSVAAEASGVAERVMLESARHEHPAAMRRTAQVLLGRLDPDGREPDDDRVRRQRGFTLAKLGDGSSVPRGLWTAELTALWEAIFDSLAAPAPAPDPGNEGDGVRDERSVAQRQHDAMVEAAQRLLRSGTLPSHGGLPVTILATTTISDLQNGVGTARIGHGQTVSVSTLLGMAADAGIVPVIMNDAGGVLAYGHARRLATSEQRLALAARDGGCSFPGCDKPPAWTETHHIREWLKDAGPTDLDNLTLLCRYHHHHFTQHGWHVVINDVDLVPDWIPPPWLDPDQRPVRNTAHHRDIDFRQPDTAA